jgi:catechol 2,3-dioxygenase-like lactoylglutathione lyase family enzyme
MTSTTQAHVDKIATIVIAVSDQERAIEFYVGKLGFAKRVDVPFGDGLRWVEVGVGDEATTIALAPPPQGASTGGKETGISLHTEDIDAYHAQLKDGGVDVDDQVMRLGDPVPPMFWLRDPEGNSLMVVR